MGHYKKQTSKHQIIDFLSGAPFLALFFILFCDFVPARERVCVIGMVVCVFNQEQKLLPQLTVSRAAAFAFCHIAKATRPKRHMVAI